MGAKTKRHEEDIVTEGLRKVGRQGGGKEIKWAIDLMLTNSSACNARPLPCGRPSSKSPPYVSPLANVSTSWLTPLLGPLLDTGMLQVTGIHRSSMKHPEGLLLFSWKCTTGPYSFFGVHWFGGIFFCEKAPKIQKGNASNSRETDCAKPHGKRAAWQGPSAGMHACDFRRP